jgi:hypothetical protein
MAVLSSNRDVAFYQQLLTGNLDKGVRNFADILGAPQSAADFFANASGLQVVYGNARNAPLLQEVISQFNYDSTALAKYAALLLGLNPADYEDAAALFSDETAAGLLPSNQRAARLLLNNAVTNALLQSDYPDLYQALRQTAINATFGDNTWDDIADAASTISANGYNAAEVQSTFGWNLGDTKAFVAGGVSYTLRILDFNHDNKSDGSGTAGISLELAPVCWGANTDARIGMEATNINTNGWQGSRMRTQTLPSYLALLPMDLQAAIKPVNKPTSSGGSSGQTLQTTSDKLWLLSQVEVDGTNSYSLVGEGTQYAYWAANNTNAARIKQQPAGTNYYWWTRSPGASGATTFVYFINNGSVSTSNATTAYAVSFGLCI